MSRAAEMGAAEMGAAEMGAAEMGAAEMGAGGRGSRRAWETYTGASRRARAQKKRPGRLVSSGTSRNAAATYSPTWWGSTIGARGLNFSVRYG